MIIAQPKEYIASFVSLMGGGGPFREYTALGLMRNGELVAGVVYNFYTGTNICMHIGAKPGRMWLNREFLHAAFDYPFNELGCRRVTGLVPKKNKDARRFDEHLGFKLEGCMRQALADDDMLIYGMTRKDAQRWLCLASAKPLSLAA